MMTDPIADLLIRVKNAAQRGHETVLIPASKLKGEILRVLNEEGFISGYELETVEGHPALRVRLRYITEGQPMITGMRRVSKPALRVYVGKGKVSRVRGGMGISILSTSKGVMTDRQSRAANTGGEVLCQVW
jgi:small subunit ribosomal protein S8